MTTRRLAVLVSYTGDGGVEKMMNHLLRGFVDAGIQVDLLLLKARGGHLEQIPEAVNVIRLDARTSLLALPAVIGYLRRQRPAALLAAKDRAGRVALRARRLARVPTRVVLRMGMHLSGSLAGKTSLQRLLRYLPVRRLYPQADAIVAVAGPVAEDLARIGSIPPERFRVIPNPVISPELPERAGQVADHPWLDPAALEATPVVLAVGRLKPQKDFATLLRAFARLHAQRTCRLIILGEGPERARLQHLARELDIADHVDLAGFRANPYPFMRTASLLVLSSRFEGSPNVLVEAMALGTPVVATDCPSGPRDILDGGRCGPLVPVGDAAALADGMARGLDAPTEPTQLQQAVADYTVEKSARAYLDALGLVPTLKPDTNTP
ncbi:glycosyltransferase [Thioalkalivibrio thiocyanoxidans]|uniref:glycosyltransferase n=1 Tax=Thioalkalivibrio thiocyanoxidans TaxID=152475 RepID=UPI00036AEA02|nr:glycosyltransferase [Thioalkalivibrio thiocyanoxidans]